MHMHSSVCNILWLRYTVDHWHCIYYSHVSTSLKLGKYYNVYKIVGK
jgi:hypothetical protein